MIGLLFSTILTSALDSLNPVAIIQQFVLQGMVKKPKHIWFFILPTGITNLLGGFLAYYGFVALLSNFFNSLFEKYKQILLVSELILGIAFLISVCVLIKKAINNDTKNIGNDEDDIARKIKSVSPFALVILGIGATISELATALPYFAFLAILLNYKLSLFYLTLLLILYNFIYTLPLIILYFIYVKAQNKFDWFYNIIKEQMTKWKKIIVPVFVGIIGVFLMVHSIIQLL